MTPTADVPSPQPATSARHHVRGGRKTPSRSGAAGSCSTRGNTTSTTPLASRAITPTHAPGSAGLRAWVQVQVGQRGPHGASSPASKSAQRSLQPPSDSPRQLAMSWGSPRSCSRISSADSRTTSCAARRSKCRPDCACLVPRVVDTGTDIHTLVFVSTDVSLAEGTLACSNSPVRFFSCASRRAGNRLAQPGRSSG